MAVMKACERGCATAHAVFLYYNPAKLIVKFNPAENFGMPFSHISLYIYHGLGGVGIHTNAARKNFLEFLKILRARRKNLYRHDKKPQQKHVPDDCYGGILFSSNKLELIVRGLFYGPMKTIDKPMKKTSRAPLCIKPEKMGNLCCIAILLCYNPVMTGL
ncbi:MAG: hypothetical protein LIQ31_02055 [Planctomycetes bacterium]|nr:hypothetical protein [Planctomycetota bacterium]